MGPMASEPKGLVGRGGLGPCIDTEYYNSPKKNHNNIDNNKNEEEVILICPMSPMASW